MPLDLKGDRFGMLVAQEWTGETSKSGRIWRCLCDCGNTKDVPVVNLRRGRVKSCGCAVHRGRPVGSSPARPRAPRAPRAPGKASDSKSIENPFRTPRQGQKAYWRFVLERQKTWYSRKFLAPSDRATTDPVLLKYWFPNLQRELDRGTAFWMEELQRHEAGHTLNTIVFRRLNHPVAWIRDVGWLDSTDDVDPALARLQASVDAGLPILTTAWQPQKTVPELIRTAALGGFEHRDAILEACGLEGSLEPLWRALQSIDNVGPWIAWQVALDLRYVHPNLSDDVWAYQGPGGKAVTSWLRPDLVGDDPQELIRWLRDTQPKRLHQYCWSGKPYYTMADVENGLCEFRRYVNYGAGNVTRANAYSPSDLPVPDPKPLLGEVGTDPRRRPWSRFRV